MRIERKEVHYNKYNQKTTTGFIILSKKTKLLNSNNKGLSPLEDRFDRKESIEVPAGTYVKYTCIETHTGNEHTVEYQINDKDNLITFYATKFIKKEG